MKRILLPAALVLVLSGGFAFAQDPQQPAPAPAEHHHRMQDPHKAAVKLGKKLNLTSDQTAKIEPIFADRNQKITALQAQTDLAPKDRRKQMHAIQKDTEQQLAGVLTPDQLQQMKSMHQGHHGKGQAEPMPAPAPPSA